MQDFQDGQEDCYDDAFFLELDKLVDVHLHTKVSPGTWLNLRSLLFYLSQGLCSFPAKRRPTSNALRQKHLRIERRSCSSRAVEGLLSFSVAV